MSLPVVLVCINFIFAFIFLFTLAGRDRGYSVGVDRSHIEHVLQFEVYCCFTFINHSFLTKVPKGLNNSLMFNRDRDFFIFFFFFLVDFLSS